MDATRERLIGTLERLSSELATSGSLAQCMRRLPRSDHRGLCAPLGSPPRPGRARRGALTDDEGLALARMALAAGAQEPDRLAGILALLAADLRRAPP